MEYRTNNDRTRRICLITASRPTGVLRLWSQFSSTCLLSLTRRLSCLSMACGDFVSRGIPPSYTWYNPPRRHYLRDNLRICGGCAMTNVVSVEAHCLSRHQASTQSLETVRSHIASRHARERIHRLQISFSDPEVGFVFLLCSQFALQSAALEVAQALRRQFRATNTYRNTRCCCSWSIVRRSSVAQLRWDVYIPRTRLGVRIVLDS